MEAAIAGGLSAALALGSLSLLGIQSAISIITPRVICVGFIKADCGKQDTIGEPVKLATSQQLQRCMKMGKNSAK
jgi:hypothetical protein